jgi:RNA polymerase sigma-70 factor (ECF subfamily)
VASGTWLQVARDLRGFRGDSAGFRGWVTAIARHRATDHLRALGCRPRPARLRPDELESWAAQDNTEDHALESVSTSAALALIARLPRDQAEAVLLHVVAGLDAPQAGRILGKRPGAVQTA